MVVSVSQHLHYQLLSASLQGRFVFELETIVAFVESSPPDELFLGYSSLCFDSILTEEVIPMEKPITKDSKSSNPNRSDSPQPPCISLSDEVCVVKHNNYQLST